MSEKELPTRHRNLILTLILITSFANPFMGSSINLALPAIGSHFGLHAVMMSWVAMSFLLSSAVLMVPLGKIADIIGRKRVFLSGTILFSLSSIFCAMSPSVGLLLASRVLQGAGGAMMFGTNMAIITDIFPANERGKAIGTNVMAVYLGLSLGPLIAGFLVKNWGWQSIFYLTAIPVAFVAISMPLLVKTEWKSPHSEQFDWKGGILYIIAMSAFMYGFSHLPNFWAIILAFISLIGLYFFVKIEIQSDFPVFDMRLLSHNRLFAMSNLAALLNYAITFAITFMLSLYLQYVKGLNPRDAGLILVIQPAMMVIVSYFSGRMSDVYDPRILASAGMSTITLGLMALIPLGTNSSLIYLMVILGVIGIGFGLFTSPNTNAIMGSVEKKYLGVASATVGTMRLTGQMISMGIATLVINIFLGNSKIHAGNLSLFLHSQRTTFIIFVILGILGVWASIARKSENLAK